jgi:hypothetical protein
MLEASCPPVLQLGRLALLRALLCQGFVSLLHADLCYFLPLACLF